MKRKIKVLHVFNGMNRGGAETLIINLMRNIDRERFQFDFLVQTTEECHYDSEIKTMGGRIIPVSHPKKGISKYKNDLKNVLDEHGPYDVVHSHIYNFSGIVLKTAKKLKVPIRIAHSHNTQDGKSNNIVRSIYRLYMRKLILNNATNLLGCSKEACESLFGTNILKDSRLEVFKNAIDFSLFKPSYDNLNLKEELNLQSETKIIGHVGSFTKQKNHSYLLKIFKHLSLVEPKAHLVLVGDGPLKSEIKQLIHDLGIEQRVHLLGVRNDVPKLMKNFDVFLFPSLYEGLGIVLIEAQAVGTSCVISDAIPKEVDLGLNLIDFISLEEDQKKWVDVINNALSEERPDWSTIEKYLDSSGYNIKQQINRICEIYD